VGVFRHPHLTRGVVRTPQGGFTISRGLVRVPDEIGESQGWQRLDTEDHPSAISAGTAAGTSAGPRGTHPRERNDG
jgi:hypothetical protein